MRIPPLLSFSISNYPSFECVPPLPEAKQPLSHTTHTHTYPLPFVSAKKNTVTRLSCLSPSPSPISHREREREGYMPAIFPKGPEVSLAPSSSLLFFFLRVGGGDEGVVVVVKEEAIYTAVPSQISTTTPKTVATSTTTATASASPGKTGPVQCQNGRFFCLLSSLSLTLPENHTSCSCFSARENEGLRLAARRDGDVCSNVGKKRGWMGRRRRCLLHIKRTLLGGGREPPKEGEKEYSAAAACVSRLYTRTERNRILVELSAAYEIENCVVSHPL